MEYQFSCQATSGLTEAILNEHTEYREDSQRLKEIKEQIRKTRKEFFKCKRDEVVSELSLDQKLQLDLASEKGASSWLTTLPVKEFGYVLNKQEFNDALALRYNMNMKDAPRTCFCGEANTMNHLLMCKKGGYVHLRHDSLRDVFAELMRNAGCKDVHTEPNLLKTDGAQLPAGSNTKDDARVDISARSFWNPLERALFDVRVLHPQAPSNRSHKDIASMYQHHENEKKRHYNARILQIEKATFSPLVFTTTGGMAPEAQKVLKRLAEKTSRRKNQRYCDVMTFLRRRLRFDLLRTTIISLRGYRGKAERSPPNIDGLDLNLDPTNQVQM
jgi:hypothetical protein